MKKEFAPYKLALRMKALGYDEPCFGVYPLNGGDVILCGSTERMRPKMESILAPTFSQAFRWLRDEYDLWGCIQKYPISENPKRCYYELRGDNINTDNDESPNSYMSGWFDSYNDAELACLTKMLDIEEAL
jgi:hypothetical protein